MTYTNDQLALLAHLEAARDEILAWVEAAPGRWAGYAPCDLDFWAEQGVMSIADYELHDMRSNIWDLYKDVHGIRPRWMNFDEMSADELRATYDSLIEELQEQNARQAKAEAEAVERFEAKIAELIGMGAGDREGALRWLRQSMSHVEELYGNEFLENAHGLPYRYLSQAA